MRWVDMGELSLKISGGTVGIKTDCGGAVGILAAFKAENAISSNSFQKVDILTFLSGQVCKISNTNAEGRLVLADGVAHAICY